MNYNIFDYLTWDNLPITCFVVLVPKPFFGGNFPGNLGKNNAIKSDGCTFKVNCKYNTT